MKEQCICVFLQFAVWRAMLRFQIMADDILHLNWVSLVCVPHVCVGNHAISSPIWKKYFSKTSKILRARRASAFWGLWRIYKCLFIPNCTRKIMWLLINNMYKKKFEMVKQKETHAYHAIRQNYAINCAIQGVRLIWKQKISLAICEFLWSLINQNAWFVTSFCTELDRKSVV